MVSEAQRLREQADRCRRLAHTMLDERMEKALREYAANVEKKAAALEGDCAEPRCSRQHIRSPQPVIVALFEVTSPCNGPQSLAGQHLGS